MKSSPICTRPIMRYHGGKWKLASWIIGFFPEHRVYVEPFGGAASVLLRKPRSYAEVYNDLDGEIVNVFRMARDRGPELKRLLALTPFARQEFELCYYPTKDPLEQARRTIARSFMGFGSGSATEYRRTDKSRGGKPGTGFRAWSLRSRTTPSHNFSSLTTIDFRGYTGGDDPTRLPSNNFMDLPSAFDAISERLRGVVIEHRDARQVMTDQDSPQTLHYVDPPYLHSTRESGQQKKRTRTRYVHEMTEREHIALAAFLETLQGAVVLSGYPSPLYQRLYKSWTCVSKETLADGARPRTECLWLRNIRPSEPRLL